MTKRKPLSKKARFEVFKRDVFTCQYCGNKPPSIILEVDHIIPIALGGCNDIDNLTTSCFDCNRGKGARSLDTSPEAISKKIEIQKEKAEQIKQFEKLMRSKKAALTRKVNKLDDLFSVETNCSFTSSFKLSIKQFFEKLPEHEVVDAMEISLAKFSHEPEKAGKYFCGVCWNKIKEQNNG